MLTNLPSRVFLFVLFLLVAFVLSGCQKQSFHNTDITGSALEAPFKLTDLSGQARTLESYRGKVLVMFFGYTHCPDVCPITLQQLAEVKSNLGNDAEKLEVVFVSVDPERDTPELLKNYVPQFDPDFNALTGPMSELKPLLEGMRVYHAKADAGTDSENYLVDHSTSSYVFDPKGNLRLLVRHNSDTEKLTEDIQTLIHGA